MISFSMDMLRCYEKGYESYELGLRMQLIGRTCFMKVFVEIKTKRKEGITMPFNDITRISIGIRDV